MAEPKELFTYYVKNGAEYCARVLGGSPADYMTKIENIVKSRIQHPIVTYLETPHEGQVDCKESTLWDFTTKYSGKVITPNGSVYKTQEEHFALIPRMLKDLTDERDAYKAKQLKEKAAGHKRESNRYKQLQTSNKIFANSVPGGFGSEYNMFYDIGSYNSITSSGRMLIASSYTLEEQLLYGNFMFDNPRAVINHLLILTRHMPPKEQIIRTMTMFRMRQPTKQELLDWIFETMDQYGRFPLSETTPIHQMVSTMSEYEVAFVWYYQNLNHIVWGNEAFFKGLLGRLFDITQYPEKTYDAAAMKTIDKDLITALTIQLCNTSILSGIKPSDLPEKAPEKISRFVSVGLGMQERIGKMQCIFDTFVNVPIVYPNLNKRRRMLRRSTILSDTDSIIFTMLKWVTWYTGKAIVSVEAYQIMSLVIYWLTKSIAPVLFDYSVSRGATGDSRYVMRMKSEFIYLVMQLFEQMKHYAGIYTVQEGYILPEPVIDIKGVQLKGSMMCPDTRDYIEKFVSEFVLLPAAHGELNASLVINETVNRENYIRRSIESGELTFCRMESIKMASEYDSASTSTSYQYVVAWNEIFGEKYGSLNPPGKFTVVEVIQKLSEEYLASLPEDIRTKMLAYKEKYNQFPKYYVINPMLGCIPEELRPLIKIRELIHHNIKPIHMILQSLNLCIGMMDKQLLYSDIYGE